MRMSTICARAAMIVTAAAAAAGADAPTTGWAFTNELTGVGSAPPPAASTALSVQLNCYLMGGYGFCDAVASGGSGPYTWSWGGASAYWTSGNYSSAHVDCSSSRYWGSISVDVQVTDSDGASSYAGAEVYCSDW